MKDLTSIAITFVITAVLLLIYFFAGQSALNRNIQVKQDELAKLIEEERQIIWMGSQITEFEGRLPDLKRRINYYKLAIPTKIEDELFFSHLASELSKHDAELLDLQQTGNRLWLGQISNTDEEKYNAAGLDTKAIQQIRTTSFKIRVYGDYNAMLTVLENLKTQGRLYTIDQVISPAGGGAGTVLVGNFDETAQMEVTGSLFFGIPETYRDAEGLDAKYMEVVVIRNARDISTDVKHSGGRVLNGYNENGPSAGSTQEQSSAEEDTEVNGAVQSVLPAGNTQLEGRG